jgi:hypothetical protein
VYKGVFSNLFLPIAHVRNVVTFPLILTFSRREKEQPLFHFLKLVSIQAAVSGGFTRRLGALLPPQRERAGVREKRGFQIKILKTRPDGLTLAPGIPCLISYWMVC